ncbi:MAG: A24 family peptidase [Francisella endosymbiont of Hyalomma asiaticum]
MYYDIYIIFLFIFLFGATIGSFLNVLIYRIPNKLFAAEQAIAREILGLDKYQSLQNFSLLTPSKCPKCHNKLKYRHNIPIIDWFLLRGKYFFYKEKISFEYLLLEFITASLFVAIFYYFGFTIQSLALVILSSFFISLFFIDAKHQILPDSLTIPLLWLGIIFNYCNIFTTLEQSVWGAIIGYLSLWLVFWVYKIFTGKEGFGHGDFKLLAAVGAWFGYMMLLYTIFVSCIFGIVIAITINLVAKRTHVIPFGTAIILATFFYILTKDNIYIWYNHVMLIQF